ncbi:MAG TPA: glycosyltransferase family 9 protein, partial [Spongiibacteraceae bacterium]
MNHKFDYKNVVVILPERLGDALFHTPALRLLKTLRPGIRLDVIALSPLSGEILKNNPHVDNVHIAPGKSETKRLAERYDVALAIHDHAGTRMYADWLDIETITITQSNVPMHRAQHSLDFMCELLGCATAGVDSHYDLFPGANNFVNVATLLREQGYASDNDILIGCHIGCHSIAKRGLKLWRAPTHPKAWPFDNFVALEAALRKKNSRIRFVLTGSKGEKSLGRKFVKLAPTAINLIDKTAVLDLAALMKSLALFITPDTGTLHVACATGIDIIALFGPTNVRVTGPHPLQKNYTVLQAQTLADITV